MKVMRFFGEAGFGEEDGHFLGDLIEARLGPGDGVHFVDGNDDMLHSHTACDEDVLFCLALEACLEAVCA